MPRSGCGVISGALARDAFASTISGSLTCRVAAQIAQLGN